MTLERLAPVAWVAAAMLAVLCVAASSAQATFPGENGMLSFDATCGAYTGLHTINPDGSGDFPLWATHQEDGFVPAEFSPDGNRLLFSRFAHPAAPGSGLADFDLFVLDLRTGIVSPVVTNPSQEAWAAWSPEGTRIAFETNRDTPPGQWQYEVYIVDLRTGEQTRLTHNALYDGPLDWSPDGRSIVVERGGIVPDLVLIDVASGHETNLTASPNVEEAAPSFAPDGTRIAFSGSTPRSYRDIYSMATDGSDIRQLTTDPDDDRFPVFSPDGTRIAFSRGAGPLVNLLSIAAGGGDERVITPRIGSGTVHRDCLDDWQPCLAGVTVRCRSQQSSSPPLPAPSPSPPAPSSADRVAPRVRVARSARLRDHRRTVVLTVTCSERCRLRIHLEARGRKLTAARDATLSSNRATAIRLRLRRSAARRMIVIGAVSDNAGNAREVRGAVRVPA